jgi:hypothetical protein
MENPQQKSQLLQNGKWSEYNTVEFFSGVATKGIKTEKWV